MYVRCPYCWGWAKLVTGLRMYPHRHDLWSKHFWRCEPCDAFVGCKPGTSTPLGSLANGPLRAKRMAAHAIFDPLWKSGGMTRSEAYEWLSEVMNKPTSKTHIGMFNVAECDTVVEQVKNKNQKPIDILT